MEKKVNATWEKYYPSREAGGHSCNIPAIYEEMALKCLYNLLIKLPEVLFRTVLVEEMGRK